MVNHEASGYVEMDQFVASAFTYSTTGRAPRLRERKIVVSRTGTGRRVRKKGLKSGRLNTRENWRLFGSLLFIVLSKLQSLDILLVFGAGVWGRLLKNAHGCGLPSPKNSMDKYPDLYH